ncbi:hypothetical protein AtNW77_Chr1g0012811 [Arabidopsis thaliana]|uniref:Transmembrane protein n=4 Tax=Arabidopsis TaxID=3701 RepID=Q56YI8_ARATH|nr:uncharacterized protein AT1G11785 [Arabidopsis thaliana]KAG7645982.1 hypothetical protein ISN45_At01g011680 [Arabidopsis thaliana x Arabidopsis arenosa]AEE28785.1 transmembrane protein [Arabidopsis thaliana]CAA0192720.1 unnamed protein product [Arabidopsis thaliana]VYS45782.1 unnamed protein product [Arabidopsis thaliana]BAD94151.1 hypothetical protein [Arabidopsis thaliana]|eukprot:NP_001077519.1 transmembrane protein [Arabidopsis thaliana]
MDCESDIDLKWSCVNCGRNNGDGGRDDSVMVVSMVVTIAVVMVMMV